MLFARSGLGKTSLLNAGVAEKLRAQRHIPLTVRVNDIERGALQSLYSGIAAASERQRIEYVPGDTASLWRFFKTAQFWREDVLLTPVLILDQFEELFTLQSEKPRGLFIDQLSYVVRGVQPAESQTETIGDASPPAVKVVLSLREDFLAELEELSDRIPGILDERFRLVPLSRMAASSALQEPAKVEDTNLATRPFKLDSEAIQKILDFLDRRAPASSPRASSMIEPFQLQLICQRLEQTAAEKQRTDTHDDTKIELKDIGGEQSLRSILEDFYKEQLATLSWIQKRRVRRLCGEFLISPQGRRLRMEESEIRRVLRVKSITLENLVWKRLLRSDQTDTGKYYELSDNSLIAPIMNLGRVGVLQIWACLLLEQLLPVYCRCYR